MPQKILSLKKLYLLVHNYDYNQQRTQHSSLEVFKVEKTKTFRTLLEINSTFFFQLFIKLFFVK